MGIVSKFLLFCSGTNTKILGRKVCKQDYDKQLAMGVTIFLTAICAFLSGGYAFYTISNNPMYSVAFGLFWGMIILSLDRQLVLSSEKQNHFQWGSLLGYAARMAVAVLLAIVIATPFELWIFRDDVNVQIDKRQEIERIGYENSLVENTDIAALKIDQEKLQAQIEERQTVLDAGREEYNDLLARYGQSSVRSISVDRNNQENQRRMFELEEKAEAIAAQIAEREQSKDQKVAQFAQTQSRNRSLIAQLRALDELSKEEPIVALAGTLIRGVSMMTDIAPMLMKMLMPFNVYDRALQKEKRKGMRELEIEEQREEEEALSQYMMDSIMASEAKMAAMQSQEWKTKVDTVGQRYAKQAGDRLSRPPLTQTPQPSPANFTNVNHHHPKPQTPPKTERSFPSPNKVADFFRNHNQYPDVNEHL